jgi:hypothetical protein
MTKKYLELERSNEILEKFYNEYPSQTELFQKLKARLNSLAVPVEDGAINEVIDSFEYYMDVNDTKEKHPAAEKARAELADLQKPIDRKMVKEIIYGIGVEKTLEDDGVYRSDFSKDDAVDAIMELIEKAR